MVKNKKFALFIFFSTFILSGCVFSSESKKTEINFSENQAENTSEEDIKNEPSEEAQNLNSAETADNKIDEKETVKKEETGAEISASFKINDKLVGWGYTVSAGRKIDTIIIHSSYNSLGGDEHSLAKVLDIYKSYGVAPHYIIDRMGKVYRLVEDKNIAYHAGVSQVSDGRENVNNFSIGIEIINTKTESPSSAQYAALKNLLSYLKEKHKIKYTLGHSDIAPSRKDDPWKFDWDKVK